MSAITGEHHGKHTDHPEAGEVSEALRERARGLGITRGVGDHLWVYENGAGAVWRTHDGAIAWAPRSVLVPSERAPTEAAALTAACDWLEAQRPAEARPRAGAVARAEQLGGPGAADALREYLGVLALSPGLTSVEDAVLAAVLKTRAEQRAKWGDTHDDEHNDNALSAVAAYLAHPGTRPPCGCREAFCGCVTLTEAVQMPAPDWAIPLWQKHNRRGRLVVAAALCIAEAERIDRRSAPSSPSPTAHATSASDEAPAATEAAAGRGEGAHRYATDGEDAHFCSREGCYAHDQKPWRMATPCPLSWQDKNALDLAQDAAELAAAARPSRPVYSIPAQQQATIDELRAQVEALTAERDEVRRWARSGPNGCAPYASAAAEMLTRLDASFATYAQREADALAALARRTAEFDEQVARADRHASTIAEMERRIQREQDRTDEARALSHQYRNERDALQKRLDATEDALPVSHNPISVAQRARIDAAGFVPGDENVISWLVRRAEQARQYADAPVLDCGAMVAEADALRLALEAERSKGRERDRRLAIVRLAVAGAS